MKYFVSFLSSHSLKKVFCFLCVAYFNLAANLLEYFDNLLEINIEISDLKSFN